MSDNKSIYVVSAKECFKEMIDHAMEKCKVQTFPLAQTYLTGILENYIHTDNLYDSVQDDGKKTRDTLAEMYLRAQNSESKLKTELLKKLGDVSLYVSGFFGDSFSRKIIDVDYYINMGESAYSSLATATKEDTVKKVYVEFSTKFLSFVDVLSFISQKAQLQNKENILRIYEKYMKTGSPLAREILVEQGIVAIPFDKSKKVSHQ